MSDWQDEPPLRRWAREVLARAGEPPLTLPGGSPAGGGGGGSDPGGGGGGAVLPAPPGTPGLPGAPATPSPGNPGAPPGPGGGNRGGGAPAPGGGPGGAPRPQLGQQLYTYMRMLSELARRVDVTSQYLAAIIEVWTMTPQAFQEKYPLRVATEPVVRALGGAPQPAEGETPAAGAEAAAGLPRVDVSTLLRVLQALEGLRQLLSQLNLGVGGERGEGEPA